MIIDRNAKPLSPTAALCACIGLTILSGCQAALPQPEPVTLDGARNLTRAGDIYVSGVTTAAGLEALRARGVQTVLDLRLPEQVEPDFAATVDNLGMNYLALPMQSAAMTDDQAQAFLDAMRKYGGQPLLIHCKSGNRSGAMYGVYVGARRKLDVEAAMTRARQAGLRNDKLAEAVRSYLERLNGSEAVHPSALAGDRTAEEIMADYDAVEMPKFDRERANEEGYRDEYFKLRVKANDPRTEFAIELFRARPEHEKTGDLLNASLAGLGEGSSVTAKLLPVIDSFAKRFPDHKLAARMLMRAAPHYATPDEQVAAYKRAIEQFPNNRATRYAKGKIRRVEGVGKPFTLDFADAISGESVSLSRLKGKVVVIDFWATWCGPCIAEMPKMKEIYAEYREKGVEFIGVSLDQPEYKSGLKKLKEYCEKNEIVWPQYYQGNFWTSAFSMSWGVNSIPAMFILDKKGNLHSTDAGGKLEEMIPELLAQRDE
ncbi:MAG: redoxin domain-containing protein [Planctomycetes bacterium]|nr:redoxin domain-containing protein [Planctomycetota bacterium]